MRFLLPNAPSRRSSVSEFFPLSPAVSALLSSGFSSGFGVVVFFSSEVWVGSPRLGFLRGMGFWCTRFLLFSSSYWVRAVFFYFFSIVYRFLRWYWSLCSVTHFLLRVYLVDFSVVLRIQVSAVAQFVFQLSGGFCYFISRVSMFD